MSAKIAVLRFPGSNCETESHEAIERVGLSGEIVRWNESVSVLDRFDGFFLPGGFSYQDRIRAGAVAARLPVLDLLVRRSKDGTPILGICNGAQILVETGIVPGRVQTDEHHLAASTNEVPDFSVDVALAPNQSGVVEGYLNRWILLGPGPAASKCPFTSGWRDPIAMPTAHAEGRFVSRSPAGLHALKTSASLQYLRPDGSPAREHPWLPNGSTDGVAGLTNEAGNVLALMPHPDRALRIAQVPDWLPGPWGDQRRAARTQADLEADGPGMAIFQGFVTALQSGGVS